MAHLPTNIARNVLGGRNLFHFTSLNLERFAQVAKDSRIYFSRPAEFNDPFEFSPYIDMDALDDEDVRRRWVNMQEDAIRNAHGEAAAAKIQLEFAAARADAAAAKDLLRLLPTSLASMLQRKYRVYCLSTQLGSVQMWSHYGAKHQGLAFEFKSLGAFFGDAFRVNYVDKAVHIDPEASNGEDLFINGLLTKAKPWASEHEYRLVATDEDEETFIHSVSGLVDFPPDELTAVYVGCRMPDACIRAVVSEAMNRPDPLPVRKMVKVYPLLSLSAEQIYPSI